MKMVLIPKFNKEVKKLINVEDVTIDGIVFNVHCRITALMLFFASAIVSMKVYVGEGPLQCISDIEDEDYHKVLETFCWATSTFTLAPKHPITETTANDDDYVYHNINNNANEEIYHAYYQWVYFILFFQAILFHAPKWFWKHAERGLMKNLVGIGNHHKLIGKEEKCEMKNILTNYFIERLKGHTDYTYTYWTYEIICLVNVLIQAFALDRFFGGDGYFLLHGIHNLKTNNFEFPGTKTMEYIFPIRTKCNFLKFGPSGGIETRDALCILSLNLYNCYIFMFMWYWFLLLILLSTLLLVHRGILIYCPWYRNVLLRTPGKNTLVFETKFVANRLSVSDWWVLYLLKTNIDPILFKDIIQELFVRLSLPKEMSQESRRMLTR